MSRTIIRAAAILALAALLVISGSPAMAAAAPARRVVVILAPYLTWDDVLKGPMPATRAAAEAGLVANMNVRPSTGGNVGPGLVRGTLMLSAGAGALSDPEALSSYSASEPVGGWTARDVYRQRFGAAAGSSAVVYLGQPAQQVANDEMTVNATIGALGEAVRRAGVRRVAIGDSDPGIVTDEKMRQRPAGIIAADQRGRVDAGDVSGAMLREDRAAPFGVRGDLAAIMDVFRREAPPGVSSLVVVDTGDLARAHDAAALSTPRATAAAHRRALAWTDQIVAAVSRELDPRRDLLMVLAPAAQEVVDQPPAFAPLIVRGAAGTGFATAASTHRSGVVTIMDASASLVDAVGGTRLEGMVGSPVARAAGDAGTLRERLDRLTADNATALGVEIDRLPFLNAYITVTVIILLASALILYRGARDLPVRIRTIARALLVLVLCVPLASVLAFALWPRPPGSVQVVLALLAVSLVIWALAVALGVRRAPGIPLLFVSGVLTVVFLMDQWFGAPLTFTGVFGYSPLLGARYYGIGNELAGLLLGASMVAFALVLDTWPDARWAHALRVWGWPIMGAIVMATTVAPFWGANVGAVAWMTVAFVVGWLMLTGRRVWTWRNVIVVAVLVVVVVAGLVAVDVMGGAGSATHLGRAFTDVEGAGGLASLWTIIARKAATNIRVLGRTNWTWLLLAVLLLLGYMRWRPRGEFAAMLKEYPAYSAALGAALMAGVVGYFTEDSGIIIPALMMIPMGVTALNLMLARNGGGSSAATSVAGAGGTE